MADILLAGKPIQTLGTIPSAGQPAPDFVLVKADLSETTLADYSGKKVVLNIFPSLDTSVCAASVRRFNAEAGQMDDTAVLCVSADLPFAHTRFCEIEGLDNVISASVFRSPEFGKDYQVLITSGPLVGLLSRAVVIVDENGKVLYSEQVPEITQEPDYEAALAVLK